ncbi:MAG: glycosyltransferase [Roseobacter sp.]
MSRLRVVHLVDDTTAGGVMRVLEHITTSPEMALTAAHMLRVVDRRDLFLGSVDADVIVSHLSISWRRLPMFLTLRASNPKIPMVHVEHSYTENFVAINVLHRKRFASLLRTSYALFDRVVAVSHAQGGWLKKRRYVSEAALHVIQSCTDMSSFRNLAPPQADRKIIGAIGRLDRQKGFDTLITAFRQCPDRDIALHIYGEGSEEKTLRLLADEDPRIHFKGFVQDPMTAMSSVDVVAMPSRWEAYGLVAIEALCAGRKLLVNDLDGMVDHIPLGAQVVEANSVTAWRTAINRLNENSYHSSPNTEISQGRALEMRFANRWGDLLMSLDLAPEKFNFAN